MVFLDHTEPKWNEMKLPKHQNFGNFGSFRSSSVESDIALIDFCKIILLFSFFQPFNAIEFFQNKILVMLCKASNSLSNLFGFFLFYKICNMITWLQFTEECSNHPTFPCFHMVESLSFMEKLWCSIKIIRRWSFTVFCTFALLQD